MYLVNITTYSGNDLCLGWLQVELVLNLEEKFWFMASIQRHRAQQKLTLRPHEAQANKSRLLPFKNLLLGDDYSSSDHEQLISVLNPSKAGFVDGSLFMLCDYFSLH